MCGVCVCFVWCLLVCSVFLFGFVASWALPGTSCHMGLNTGFLIHRILTDRHDERSNGKKTCFCCSLLCTCILFVIIRFANLSTSISLTEGHYARDPLQQIQQDRGVLMARR